MLDPDVLPPNLPVPQDDGPDDHLTGLELPSLVLESSQGPVDVSQCEVPYVDPRSGKPGVPTLPGWDESPVISDPGLLLHEALRMPLMEMPGTPSTSGSRSSRRPAGS